MKRSLMLAAAALAAITVVAAGCGGSDEVPSDAVAVVDGTTISRSTLDELLARAKKSYTAQKRSFPKAGTSEYQTLQTQAVAFLVQREEYAREAEQLGIEVTDTQIAKKLDEVKKQYFGGSQTKFEKGLKDQGYTEATLREDIRSQLLTEGIYNKVTNDVKVTDADVKAYYEKNRANYAVAESRSVRHILVKTKAEADRIYSQLEGGADFAVLAKQSSLDPGSKDQGGRLTVTRGQTVAPFDKAAFSLKTNQISQPVKTQFGYHVIQPLSDVKPGSVTPFAQVKAQIKTQLDSESKNTAVNKWVAGVEKEYKDKVQYAAGFEPPDTSTTTDQTTSTSG
jgi:parvulin-like peptidyl-prolyl isomerase